MGNQTLHSLRSKRDVAVTSLYRPGSAVVTPNFFAQLTTFLENLLALFDMCQHVQDAKHIAGGCLDLIITQSEVKVTDPLVSNIGYSDNCLVTCQLLVNLPEVRG